MLSFSTQPLSTGTMLRTQQRGGNILVASDDFVVTNDAVSWILNSMVPAGNKYKVHLLHCVPMSKHHHQPVPGEEARLGHLPLQDPAALHHQEEMRQMLGSRLAQAQVEYNVHVVPEESGSNKTGRVGATLCKWAEHLDAVATVVSSKHRGGLTELLHGSVANYVTHHCTKPVVVLHNPTNPNMSSGMASSAFSSNILLALDDGDNSEAACRWTLDSLYSPGDTIHLMHIIPCLPPVTEMPPFEGSALVPPAVPWEQAEREEQEWRETQMARYKTIMDEAGAHYTFDVVIENTQDPVTTISEDMCKMAARLQAKAVVCTARDHGGISELLFNSVANLVAHHCDQPVVVLPAGGKNAAA